MTPKHVNKIDEKSHDIKKMAVFLREGHTLLSDACPKCNAPLFKMKSGEIYCVVCDKRVVIVKDESQIDIIMQNKVLDDLTKILNMKIRELNEKLDLEKDINELYDLTRLLINYLESLRRLKDLKSK